YRLARAIASITAWGEASSDYHAVSVVEPIRANLLPLVRRGKRWAWDDTSRSAVWSRAAPLDVNLAAVLRRRLGDAQRGGGNGLPLWSSFGAGFDDLLAFWNREVDEPRLAEFIHGLALVESDSGDQQHTDRAQRRVHTPDLKTSAVWFLGDKPKITIDLP